MKQPKAIYVHIPFCKARCGYCAFSSCCDFFLLENYFDVLCREIENADFDGCRISTMFWGGGTPSCVPIFYLEKLYNALCSKFDLSALQEFTVECNPESTSQELLSFLKKIGVNRISFGLQSVNDVTLSKIGRLHNFADFQRVLQWAVADGFNVNADLILGLPETQEEFYNSVKTVSKMPVCHISLYALEIHENTPFQKICQAYSYTDDQLAEMYDNARTILSKHGFDRYEVSNFAQKGCQCLHNLTYWTENRYFGFGAAASGFVGNLRYGNAFDVKKYIQSGGAKKDYQETISATEEIYEYVMLGLRLQNGFALQDFFDRFGQDFFQLFPNAQSLLQREYLSVSSGNVFLPDDKFYVLNSVLVELLPD